MNVLPRISGDSRPSARRLEATTGSCHCRPNWSSVAGANPPRLPTSIQLVANPDQSEQSSKTEQKALMIDSVSRGRSEKTGNQWVVIPPSASRPCTSWKYSREERFTMPAFLGGGGSAVRRSKRRGGLARK